MNTILTPATTHLPSAGKNTFRQLHPSLSFTLDETIIKTFGSVRAFAHASNLHPTRVYSFLREGDAGSMPRMDSFTEMLRAIEAASPLAMDQIMTSFIIDVDPRLSVSISRGTEESAPLEAVNARYRELLSEWGVEKMKLLFEVVSLLSDKDV